MDMSPVAKEWMNNPPKDVACPDDPPKRFADFPKRLGSTATWELYPSPPAPEQEPPKDPIPEPLPELPEEPKDVAPKQLEEVETKVVDAVTEVPKRDLFHSAEQVTRAEQMEHRKTANMEVEEEDGEDRKDKKRKPRAPRKPATAKAKAKASAKAKAKVSEKSAAKAEAKAKAKAAPRKRKEAASSSKPKKVKPALPGVPGDGEQPALPGDGEQPALPGDGEQPALPADEQPSLPGDGEQPALPGDGEQPALPGDGEQPALPGDGKGSKRQKRQTPEQRPLEGQPAPKKTFAGRNRPSTKEPSKRFDSIREIFEKHIKNSVRTPTSLEAWIT